jgi:hypothetical protein
MVNADGSTILRYSPEKHMIFWVVIDFAPGVMARAQHRVIARHGSEYLRDIRGSPARNCRGGRLDGADQS